MTDSELRIESGAAERIATAFDDYADGLAGAAERLRESIYATGLAGFPSATELDAGFLRKRDHAVIHLMELAANARGVAVSVRAAGRAYERAENSSAAAIREVAVDLGNEPFP